MTDLLITGGRVIDPASGIDETLDVLVRDGRIAQVGTAIEGGDTPVFDAAGCIVAPGLVDLHTHLREPGFEHKGTIASETAAAAAGGFTTVCAMPNTVPAPDSAPVVQSLRQRIAADAVVRVLPIGCVTAGRQGKRLADLDELAEAGCVAFSDDGDAVASPELMRRALEIAGSLDLPLSEHSIDAAVAAGGVMHEGAISERLGLPGEPAAAEIAAISRDIELAELTGAHLHVAHISTARGVALVAGARERGLHVTAEVTPSHLALTHQTVFGDGQEPVYNTRARINPPLRTEADRLALIAGLRDGIVDAIATDHAPHAVQDKECEFEEAAPGISCLETALSTAFALVDEHGIPLARIIEALTIGPVRAFGLDRHVPGIGSLGTGAPADIVIFDPAGRWTVDADRFVSKGHNSPLHGRTLPGVVRATIAEGRIVFDAASQEVSA